MAGLQFLGAGFFVLRPELMACGIAEVHNLPSVATNSNSMGCDEKVVGKAFMENVIEKALRGVTGRSAHLNTTLRKGLLLATTTEHQPTQATWLEKVGFEKVKTFKNPNSANMVTVWLGETLKVKEIIEGLLAEEGKKK